MPIQDIESWISIIFIPLTFIALVINLIFIYFQKEEMKKQRNEMINQRTESYKPKLLIATKKIYVYTLLSPLNNLWEYEKYNKEMKKDKSGKASISLVRALEYSNYLTIDLENVGLGPAINVHLKWIPDWDKLFSLISTYTITENVNCYFFRNTFYVNKSEITFPERELMYRNVYAINKNSKVEIKIPQIILLIYNFIILSEILRNKDNDYKSIDLPKIDYSISYNDISGNNYKEYFILVPDFTLSKIDKAHVFEMDKLLAVGDFHNEKK